jgi:hypothetical protein
MFRSDVRNRCAAVIGPLLSLDATPARIVDLVKKLQSDFNYIFPRRVNGTVSVQSAKVALTNTPLNRAMFSSVHHNSVGLIAAPLFSRSFEMFFFPGLNHLSHNTRLAARFPSRQGTSGEIIWEVPKAMVALVSTAVSFSL